MGMCAFTFCTPCWCAAGFGTAAGPLCCCKNWCGANTLSRRKSHAVSSELHAGACAVRYFNSKAQRVQVVGGALAVTLGLFLYIFMRVRCMEKSDCTTECPVEPYVPRAITDGQSNSTDSGCTTTCQDAPFRLWESSACRADSLKLRCAADRSIKNHVLTNRQRAMLQAAARGLLPILTTST